MATKYTVRFDWDAALQQVLTDLVAAQAPSEADEAFWAETVKDLNNWTQKPNWQADAYRYIPKQHRDAVWNHLLKRMDLEEGNTDPDNPALLAQLDKAPCENEGVISRNIHMNTSSFSEAISEADTVRLLRAVSIIESDIGYNPALAILAVLLLDSLPADVAANTILKFVHHHMRFLLIQGTPGLRMLIFQLQAIIEKKFPALHAHLTKEAFSFPLLTVPWFLTLFTSQLPANQCLQLLTAVMAEGNSALLKAAVCLFDIFQEDILKKNSEDIVAFFRSVATDDVAKSINFIERIQNFKHVSNEFIASLEAIYVDKEDQILPDEIAFFSPFAGLREVVVQLDEDPNLGSEEEEEDEEGFSIREKAVMSHLPVDDTRPPQSPVKQWDEADQLDPIMVETMRDILTDADSAQVFCRFLEDRKLQREPVFFVIAAEKFTTKYSKVVADGKPDYKKLASMAMDVYHTFLADDARERLQTVDPYLVKQIMPLLAKPPQNVFANLQRQCFELLADPFVEFVQQNRDILRKKKRKQRKAAPRGSPSPTRKAADKDVKKVVKDQQKELQKIKKELEEARQLLQKTMAEGTINKNMVMQALATLGGATSTPKVESSAAKKVPSFRSETDPAKPKAAAAGSSKPSSSHLTDSLERLERLYSSSSERRPILPTIDHKLKTYMPTPVEFNAELNRWNFVDRSEAKVNATHPGTQAVGGGTVGPNPATAATPSEGGSNIDPSSYLIDRLHIVSYNVSNETHPKDNIRFEKFLQILESMRADVILLQEVTPAFLKVLREAKWVQRHYYLSDVTGNTFREKPFGQIIVSRFRFQTLRLAELRSREGRTAIAALFEFNGRKVGIASVHLDDGEDDDLLRADQIQTIFQVMRNIKCVDFFVGGNFCSDKRFAALVDSDMASACSDVFVTHCLDLVSRDKLDEMYAKRKEKDAAANKKKTLKRSTLQLAGGEEEETKARVAAELDYTERLLLKKFDGDTVKTEKNHMATMLTRQGLRRPDRIIMYSPNYWHTILGCKLIGNREIGSQAGFFPSGHFGLSLVVAASSEPDTEPQAADTGACVIS